MATTVGERLATLEALAARNREGIAQLRDDVHGGASVEWAQSVRGRLHHMQSAIEAADKLADATRELVRAQESARLEQEKARKSRLTRAQWVYLAACSTVAAAAPYVLFLGH